MIFTYLLAVHLLTAQKAESVEIPILHSRASKVLAKILPLTTTDSDLKVSLSADDPKGVIVAKGSANNIETIKTYLGLFDVERAKVSFKLTVESNEDKQSYEVSARILNNQEWKSSDSDTGISVSLTPRTTDDGTVTMFMASSTKDVAVSKVVFRLKHGESVAILLGKDSALMQADRDKNGNFVKWSGKLGSPKLTVKLD